MQHGCAIIAFSLIKLSKPLKLQVAVMYLVPRQALFV